MKSKCDLSNFYFEKSHPKKILHGLYLKGGSKRFLFISIVYVYAQLVMGPAHSEYVHLLFGSKREGVFDSLL